MTHFNQTLERLRAESEGPEEVALDRVQHALRDAKRFRRLRRAAGGALTLSVLPFLPGLVSQGQLLTESVIAAVVVTATVIAQRPGTYAQLIARSLGLGLGLLFLSKCLLVGTFANVPGARAAIVGVALACLAVHPLLVDGGFAPVRYRRLFVVAVLLTAGIGVFQGVIAVDMLAWVGVGPALLTGAVGLAMGLIAFGLYRLKVWAVALHVLVNGYLFAHTLQSMLGGNPRASAMLAMVLGLALVQLIVIAPAMIVVLRASVGATSGSAGELPETTDA